MALTCIVLRPLARLPSCSAWRFAQQGTSARFFAIASASALLRWQHTLRSFAQRYAAAEAALLGSACALWQVPSVCMACLEDLGCAYPVCSWLNTLCPSVLLLYVCLNKPLNASGMACASLSLLNACGQPGAVDPTSGAARLLHLRVAYAMQPAGGCLCALPWRICLAAWRS